MEVAGRLRYLWRIDWDESYKDHEKMEKTVSEAIESLNERLSREEIAAARAALNLLSVVLKDLRGEPMSESTDDGGRETYSLCSYTSHGRSYLALVGSDIPNRFEGPQESFSLSRFSTQFTYDTHPPSHTTRCMSSPAEGLVFHHLVSFPFVSFALLCQICVIGYMYVVSSSASAL